MSELEDKLNSILSDPQTMSQIMALAQSLGGGPSGKTAPQQDDAAQTPPTSPEGAVPDLSALAGLFTGGGEGGLDPRMLSLLSRVMREYQADDSSKAALLLALRPYVKEKRYAKLDRAVQIARLSRLVRIALEVFKGGGQDL